MMSRKTSPEPATNDTSPATSHPVRFPRMLRLALRPARVPTELLGWGDGPTRPQSRPPRQALMARGRLRYDATKVLIDRMEETFGEDDS